MIVTFRHDKSRYGEGEVESIVASALNREVAFARERADFFRHQCASFEREHAMTSDEFLTRFELGELGDDEYLFDWYAAKMGLDEWAKRAQLLDGYSIEP